MKKLPKLPIFKEYFLLYTAMCKAWCYAWHVKTTTIYDTYSDHGMYTNRKKFGSVKLTSLHKKFVCCKKNIESPSVIVCKYKNTKIC